MIAIVTAVCLNMSSPCTLDRAFARAYMVYHDDIYHDADICDLQEEVGPTKDAEQAVAILALSPKFKGGLSLFYKCVKNFTTASGDREIPNIIEMVPAQIPLIRQKIKENPDIINRLKDE